MFVFLREPSNGQYVTPGGEGVGWLENTPEGGYAHLAWWGEGAYIRARRRGRKIRYHSIADERIVGAAPAQYRR